LTNQAQFSSTTTCMHSRALYYAPKAVKAHTMSNSSTQCEKETILNANITISAASQRKRLSK